MEIIYRVFLKNLRVTNKNTLIRSIAAASSSKRTGEPMEELQKNPYYEKYATKIAKLQQTSPEEFLSRIEAQQQQQRQNEGSKSAAKEANRQQYSSLLKPKEELASQVGARDEPLDKIMKVELVENKDVNEITRIWQEYHIHKDVIAAAIPSSEYDLICEQAEKYPLFLFPLPRSQGYEFIVSEFRRNAVHFTPLICYQVHKENAPECLTIKHYVEFKESKGLVLMRGEFDKNVIDVKEAQCLANQLQLYYGQRYPEKTELLRRFTTRPEEFKHADLIKQIESLTL